MLEEAEELAADGMTQAQDRLKKELARVRTGRANPALLDDVKVDSYGTQVPLKQAATVSVAEARLLVVKPYDRNNIPSIERAINNSQLGLNASNDGLIVRVPIPALTEERRKDLVKQAHSAGEDAKVMIRQARRDANDLLKKAEKDKDISEDDLKRGLENIQETTNAATKAVDDIIKKKETEILDN
ncbi:MAG: ribosome recycling factor [Deltaproteobacteria bacterium]|nr:ribosome recycling factor [Deltaproteobacteria bacterium]